MPAAKRQGPHNALHDLAQRNDNLPVPRLSIEADDTNRLRDLDESLSAFFREPVRARCVGERVAEEAIDGGLARAQVDRVGGVRVGEDAADFAVGGGEVGGEVSG